MTLLQDPELAEPNSANPSWDYLSNLINNLDSRSMRRPNNPYIDDSNKADYNSCYTSENISSMALTEYAIGVDLGETKFVHATLFVNDIRGQYVGNFDDDELLLYYLSQVYVYVGDSETYSENTVCPGGPYLDENLDDYYDEYADVNYGA